MINGKRMYRGELTIAGQEEIIKTELYPTLKKAFDEVNKLAKAYDENKVGIIITWVLRIETPE